MEGITFLVTFFICPKYYIDSKLHFLNNLTRSTKLIETHLEIYEDEIVQGHSVEIHCCCFFSLCPSKLILWRYQAKMHFFYYCRYISCDQHCANSYFAAASSMFRVSFELSSVISQMMFHFLNELLHAVSFLWNLLLSIHSNYSINATALYYIITHRKAKQCKWSQPI